MAEAVWTPGAERAEQANPVRPARRQGCSGYRKLQHLPACPSPRRRGAVDLATGKSTTMKEIARGI